MTDLARFIQKWIHEACDSEARDPEFVVFADHEGFRVQDLADAITDVWRIEERPIEGKPGSILWDSIKDAEK